MKRSVTALLLLLLLLIPNRAHTQNAVIPGYEAVRSFASEKSEYDKLMTRMLEGDTISEYEYGLLYYGNGFRNPHLKDMAPVVENSIAGLIAEEKFAEALTLCEQYLVNFPLSMLALRMYMLLLINMDKKERTAIVEQRLDKLEKVVLSSGDGSVFKPFQVVFSGDVRNLVMFPLGYSRILNVESSDRGDTFTVADPDSGSPVVIRFAYDFIPRSPGNEPHVIEIPRPR